MFVLLFWTTLLPAPLHVCVTHPLSINHIQNTPTYGNNEKKRNQNLTANSGPRTEFLIRPTGTLPNTTRKPNPASNSGRKKAIRKWNRKSSRMARERRTGDPRTNAALWLPLPLPKRAWMSMTWKLQPRLPSTVPPIAVPHDQVRQGRPLSRGRGSLRSLQTARLWTNLAIHPMQRNQLSFRILRLR